MLSNNRSIYLYLISLVILIVFIFVVAPPLAEAISSPSGQAAPAADVDPQTVAEPRDAAGQSELLQFMAGGQALEFRPGAMTTTAHNHSLIVTFVDSTQVRPAASGPTSAHEQVRPMAEVVYKNLWPGINLNYARAAGGVVKSTFHIMAGSDVDQIRLGYNVPVSVNAGGGLRFEFASGQLTEPSPTAYQQIAGRRVPVTVAYDLVGEREVGFRVGSYDPTYPLTIE